MDLKYFQVFLKVPHAKELKLIPLDNNITSLKEKIEERPSTFSALPMKSSVFPKTKPCNRTKRSSDSDDSDLEALRLVTKRQRLGEIKQDMLNVETEQAIQDLRQIKEVSCNPYELDEEELVRCLTKITPYI